MRLSRTLKCPGLTIPSTSPRKTAEQLILKHTILSRDHLTPELNLHLITPQTRLWHDKGNQSSEVFDRDPFWAIYWPGGQALARFILNHPELVKGKQVFDLGCGGGAISMACALSGAKSVLANDIDPLALEATKINAGVNDASSSIKVCSKNYLKLDPTDLRDLEPFDVLCIGDMYFDEDIGRAVGSLSKHFLSWDQRSRFVFIGDPGRWFLTEQRPANLFCRAKFELPENVKKENSGLNWGYVYEVVKS